MWCYGVGRGLGWWNFGRGGGNKMVDPIKFLTHSKRKSIQYIDFELRLAVVHNLLLKKTPPRIACQPHCSLACGPTIAFQHNICGRVKAEDGSEKLWGGGVGKIVDPI